MPKYPYEGRGPVRCREAAPRRWSGSLPAQGYSFLLFATLAGCTSEPAPPPGPPLDPIAFFTGRSHGHSVLRLVGKGERKVAAVSIGTPQRDGSLVLDQGIAGDGASPRTRRWVMRRVGPGRYSGSLTDAVGPFSADQVGGGLRIRYTMKNGLEVEQWLVPIAGRQAIDNRLTVRKWGFRLAYLRETIVKSPS